MYRIYTYKKKIEKSVDLLLLSNAENPYYLLIKNLYKFMTNKTKCQGKKRFCRYGL